MEASYILTYVLPTVIEVIFFRREYIPFSLKEVENALGVLWKSIARGD